MNTLKQIIVNIDPKLGENFSCPFYGPYCGADNTIDSCPEWKDTEGDWTEVYIAPKSCPLRKGYVEVKKKGYNAMR